MRCDPLIKRNTYYIIVFRAGRMAFMATSQWNPLSSGLHATRLTLENVGIRCKQNLLDSCSWRSSEQWFWKTGGCGENATWVPIAISYRRRIHIPVCIFTSLVSWINSLMFDRDKLRANLLLKQYYLEVDLQHVVLYNEEMAHAIQERPGEIMPSVCWPSIHCITLVFINGFSY